MTHICVGNLTIIGFGSDNGLSPGRRQAIIWTNAEILLIEPLGTNFSEIAIEIHTFSFKKMHLKLSGKWHPFFLRLTGWETKFFWHSPELSSLLFSLYQNSTCPDLFSTCPANFSLTLAGGRALVSQPGLNVLSMGPIIVIVTAVACAKICSNQFIRIWIRTKCNFHQIWITMEKSSLFLPAYPSPWYSMSSWSFSWWPCRNPSTRHPHTQSLISPNYLNTHSSLYSSIIDGQYAVGI